MLDVPQSVVTPVVNERLGGMKELKKLENRVIVSCKNEWKRIDVNLVVEIAVSDNCCEEEEMKVLDLSRFVSLRELRVGNYCFSKTAEVELIGLHALEKVIVGNISFVKLPYSPEQDGKDPNRHFNLKDCERLRLLKIGSKSFMDYSVCEIENVPSLEVIEMGELSDMSCNFWYASLELKSMLVRVRMMTRRTKVEITCVWK